MWLSTKVTAQVWVQLLICENVMKVIVCASLTGFKRDSGGDEHRQGQSVLRFFKVTRLASLSGLQIHLKKHWNLHRIFPSYHGWITHKEGATCLIHPSFWNQLIQPFPWTSQTIICFDDFRCLKFRSAYCHEVVVVSVFAIDHSSLPKPCCLWIR